MSKKLLSYILILLLLNLACFSVVHAQQDDKLAAKVKNAVIDNGTGYHAKVVVKLFDGRKIKGHTDRVTDDRFIVIEDKSNNSTEIFFTQVKVFKGKKHLNGKKILIGAGLAGFLLFLGIIYSTTDGV